MKNTPHEYVDENGSCWCCGQPKAWSAHRRHRRFVKRRWKRKEFAAMMQTIKERGKHPCKIETIWVAKHVTVLSTRSNDDTERLTADWLRDKTNTSTPGTLYWIGVVTTVLVCVLLALTLLWK